jgi:type IV secretion system protein VirD4
VDADRPVSLYLVIPPSDISRTKPLVRLVLNQIGRRLTERLEGDPGKRRRHELLMMLDEFPALGRLDFFETALAFMAGYGTRAYLIAQSLNQISKAYGENNAILDNCHLRVAFSSNDERTAKRISDALGTATELRAQRNYAGHRLSPWLSHVMVSSQETARPLLTPGEVMQLPPTDELVLVSGLAPIRAKKLRYYEDRNLSTRVAPALDKDGYRDRPPSRPDDWGRQVRGPDRRLAAVLDEEARAGQPEEGGLRRQRHPGLPEKDVVKPNAERAVDLGLSDGSDTAADTQVMDRSRGLGTVGRAHAMNEGEPQRDPGRDLLPE